MKLDCYGAQYGGQAAVIGQKIETFGCDYRVAYKHKFVVQMQSLKAAFDQSMLIQIYEIGVKFFFFFASKIFRKIRFVQSVWMGFGEFVKQFQLIFSINAHDVWRPCQFKLFKMITRLTPLNQGGVQ